MIEPNWDVSHLAVGDDLHVQVMKEGGRPFRNWTTVIESVEPGRLVTWSAPGQVMRTRIRPLDDSDFRVREWRSPWGMRNVYWAGRPYNLLEIYHADGPLEELYVHVAGPPTLGDHHLTWTDYELDVVMHPGGLPKIVDEDEFAAAVLAYGYSPEFQAACYRVAHAAAALLKAWTPLLPPATRY